MFPIKSKFSLARSVLLKDRPVYVQFYVTARCNLTCQQCNIIYANSDLKECGLDKIEHIADNFAKIGVAIVLLTGGEPFCRQDLPEIIRAFTVRGIHVRMQTNGFATEEQIHKAVEYGGRDISISLDSLTPARQDSINGDFRDSWFQALRAMALFTKYMPSVGSFASLGCVLQRTNLSDIESVIRFGTAIGWFTSLVPVHVTTHSKPLNFRTYDQSLRFREDEWSGVDSVIEKVRRMRKDGFLLYDSDQYLDDIKRFVRDDGSTTWRSKNNGVCDSPNLYFAVLPNGHFAPCCDHRLPKGVAAYAADFPKTYYNKQFRQEVLKVTGNCAGCMYGSYPEMTISMRFLAATLDRIKLFVTSPPVRNWPLTYEQILAAARLEAETQAVTEPIAISAGG